MGPAALADPGMRELLAPLVEKAALAQTINLAWGMVAAISLGALLLLPLARREIPR